MRPQLPSSILASVEANQATFEHDTERLSGQPSHPDQGYPINVNPLHTSQFSGIPSRRKTTINQIAHMLQPSVVRDIMQSVQENHTNDLPDPAHISQYNIATSEMQDYLPGFMHMNFDSTPDAVVHQASQSSFDIPLENIDDLIREFDATSHHAFESQVASASLYHDVNAFPAYPQHYAYSLPGDLATNPIDIPSEDTADHVSNETIFSGNLSSTVADLRKILADAGFENKTRIFNPTVESRISVVNATAATLIEAVRIARTPNHPVMLQQKASTYNREDVLYQISLVFKPGNLNPAVSEAIKSANNNPEKIVANIINRKPERRKKENRR